MLGLALRQLLEAMCHPAKSPLAMPWRKLLEKAELAAPTGTASLLCTMRPLGFWPSSMCPKTGLTGWWSRGVRSLLAQHGLAEAGRAVPGGGKPRRASRQPGGSWRGRGLGDASPLFYLFIAPVCAYVHAHVHVRVCENTGRTGTVTAGRKAEWCSALRWLLIHQLLEVAERS